MTYKEAFLGACSLLMICSLTRASSESFGDKL
jgi:hypothetical protein